MDNAATLIRTLRDETGFNRREFAEHIGIPLRTLEDWEACRRTPPAYLPRLIASQLKYEKLLEELGRTDDFITPLVQTKPPKTTLTKSKETSPQDEPSTPKKDVPTQKTLLTYLL